MTKHDLLYLNNPRFIPHKDFIPALEVLADFYEGGTWEAYSAAIEKLGMVPESSECPLCHVAAKLDRKDYDGTPRATETNGCESCSSCPWTAFTEVGNCFPAGLMRGHLRKMTPEEAAYAEHWKERSYPSPAARAADIRAWLTVMHGK